ncbi:hypothetical protein FB107DRAFT_267846 [Schizophyllum commune]
MSAHDKAAARARFEAAQRRVAHWVADVRAASAAGSAHAAGPSRVPKISRTRTRYDPTRCDVREGPVHCDGTVHSDARDDPTRCEDQHEGASLCQRRRAPQPSPILVCPPFPTVVPPPPPPFFASSAGSMSTEEDTIDTIRTPEPHPPAGVGAAHIVPHSSPAPSPMRLSPSPLSSTHAPIPLFMSASTPPTSPFPPASSLAPSPRKELQSSPRKEHASSAKEHIPTALPYPLTQNGLPISPPLRPTVQPTRSPLMRAAPAHCALPSIRKSRRSPLVAVSPPATAFRF